EELKRVIPAIKAIRRISNIPLSIDTTKSSVAEQALDSGADIVNDISAMRFDPKMAILVRNHCCPAVIMHMQGTPKDMQIKPSYTDVIAETIAFFRERLASLGNQGVDLSQIIIDPGIGFGKSLAHNLTILNNAAAYQVLNCPVLIGHSRKSFLCSLLGQDLKDRDQPTAVIAALLAQRQVSIVRVHDVTGTKQALQLAEGIARA
ncbi:MAG: dihydropteroate synthase, partial [Desulfobulbaceae bacterium]|nr:dihydropteroate synthase [Desulfobulbaceae bacterium]